MASNLDIEINLNGQQRVVDGIDSVTKSIGDMAKQLGAAYGVMEFTSKLVAVQREFDVLNSSLVTMTGSAANAKIAFGAIQEFAQKTP